MKMRERRYVKFRTDMHDDTKSKIIDRMCRRDLIHYVWNRFVLLAGKVNKEGDLYMSRNIPYTVETLSIEFNRDVDEIKIALDVLIELEMMEITEDKVYMVKNFAKHQNIKTKEKIEVNDKEIEVNDAENNIIKNIVEVTSEVQNQACTRKSEIQSEELEEEACAGKREDNDSKLNKADVMPLADCIEANSEAVYKSDDNKENERTSSQYNNQPVILEMKKSQKTNRKNKKVSKKKVKDDIIETEDENLIGNIEEGKEDVYFWNAGEDISLKDGERVVAEWGL